jgi:hypothetical protein
MVRARATNQPREARAMARFASRRERTVKKTEKKQKKSAGNHAHARSIVDASGVIDWSPLRGAARDALRWARELAMAVSRNADDARVAGVFKALEGIVDGTPYERVPLGDILLVLRSVGGAVERDLEITPSTFDLAASLLGIAFGSIDDAHSAPAPTLPAIYHRTPRVGPRVVHTPPTSLAELCALANRIVALVGPSGPLAADFHR